MSNCETCRDKDWCSSEEMDSEACPVRPQGNLTKMKFHAIITIVDDDNKMITSFHKEECEQFKIPLTNTIFHNFNLRFSIAGSKEMMDFIEEGGK